MKTRKLSSDKLHTRVLQLMEGIKKMLSVSLTFSQNDDLIKILQQENFKKEATFLVYWNHTKKLITAATSEANSSIELTFSPGLGLEEYTQIHQVIVTLAEKLNAEVDDQKALLGYLKNSEGAYILTNWQKWYEFLQEAKFITLKGKKIRVLDENEQEKSSGLFVHYKLDEQTRNICECTLITLFGEKKITGNDLTIEPTNEW
jgi:hypothetical protein